MRWPPGRRSGRPPRHEPMNLGIRRRFISEAECAVLLVSRAPAGTRRARRLGPTRWRQHRSLEPRRNLRCLPMLVTGSEAPRFFWARESGNLADGVFRNRVARTPSPPGDRVTPSNVPAERLYCRCRRRPAMAINATRNRRSGPGGSSRRLHQIPLWGSVRGRIRLDARDKGVVFARHGTAVIGPSLQVPTTTVWLSLPNH
jgi:hypothetical protein